jgi:hypothetical protein
MLSYEQVHVRNESLSEVGPRDRDVRSTLDCVAKASKRCANNFRKKADQATIVDRCILKRASEVASELRAIRCGPPYSYRLSRLWPEKIVLGDAKRLLQHYPLRSGCRQVTTAGPKSGQLRTNSENAPRLVCIQHDRYTAEAIARRREIS